MGNFGLNDDSRIVRFKHIDLDNDSEVLSQHFECLEMIKTHYRERDKNPGALAAAIAACKRQIQIAPQAARAFLHQYPGTGLPDHTGFKQLAIIRAKQANYEEAIRLCEQARDQGWTQGCTSVEPDWDKRIERYRKSLNKFREKQKKSEAKTTERKAQEPAITHIEYQCPHCNHRLRIPLQYAGMVGRCRFCYKQITAPVI